MSEFWINLAFSVMFQVVKNTAHVSSFKKALRKLRDILATLPLD
jgi:hypothetical protein